MGTYKRFRRPSSALAVGHQLAMDWGEQPFLEKHASRNVFDWDLDFLVILAHNCQCMSNSQSSNKDVYQRLKF
ncbi:hypothetical protein Y1Q_0021807 [Alligator mississippiensis]|uniref:Uncharacterized protein n=1 Tax=Alligator mississippiensis TaxID=8496 RepID=A0A151PB68_ALLMI|nr:hypothetical protein Y1Q_0021807 [Alligator mississippiensis]